MASIVPQKIVLKSTTKMSLNDRFSTIRKAPMGVQVRATIATQQQASAKNRRLAQQMANRPAVIAALSNPVIAKPSLQQRLGSNVKSRLTLNSRGGTVVRGAIFRGRGRGRGMSRGLSRSAITLWTGEPQVVRTVGVVGSRGQLRARGRGRVLSRGASVVQSASAARRGRVFRGGITASYRGRGFRGGRGVTRGRGGIRGRGTQSGRGRGAQSGRGRGTQLGRGRGRGRGGMVSAVSREQLDTQLDEYMSKTRSQLDAEMDAYMAQSGDF